MKRRHEAVARGPFHCTQIFAKSAKGAVITDVDGNELIDFAAGIGVVNVGHCNPHVVEAIQRQAAELVHGSFNVTPYERYVQVAEKLNQLTPGSFKKKTFLANSGAEAVENAIKIARAFTNRPAIVSFEHGFHGRTYMAMTLTAKDKPYKTGFGPFNSEVYRAPYPDPYRWPGGAERVSAECFAKFEELIQQIGPAKVAAVIFEPVLGEGGFIPFPKDFLASLSSFCKRNGTVLIADEIQSGFGRTGTLFASEQLGLEPDLITLAKGLAAGMPLSAVTGRAEIMDAPIEGGIGGTYGGNPVACAAALAVFELFEKGDLLARSKRLGEKIEARLRGWQQKYSVIGNVRGLGPMQAIELVKDPKSKEPNPEATKALMAYCNRNGLIIMSAGTYGNVIRLLMPLVIEDGQLERGFTIMEQGLQEISK
ncbi:MAG TPA: 4-aminobutyrate--2-oxoglutarate transaminase [Bdellovibrionales bacterium]|nr:4-aminobutyrate--2-oxoglutarate transaminase [Bdellovibrionales bacterium]